jgi:ADP-heptose:LPS heptosyltransferase
MGGKMYRNNEELQMYDRVNFVLNHAALGDMICSLPAIVHARLTHHESMKMFVWVPSWQMDLVAHLLEPYGAFIVKDLEKFPMKKAERKLADLGPTALNQAPFDTHTRNRVHMVDYAFRYLLDAQPESMFERSYPTAALLGPRQIQGKYVVFPVGATSLNKLFKAKVMVPIMEWVHSRGYSPVVVGTKTSHTKVNVGGTMTPIVMIDESQHIPAGHFLDWREKTTLLELRDICGHAAAVVGVDGGTIHLAGTTPTNIIYGLTTTEPKHRYIARNGDPECRIRYVVPRDLECAGCQSHMTLLFNHDFRNCVYGDNKCVDMLHPEDFINGLKELGL